MSKLSLSKLRTQIQQVVDRGGFRSSPELLAKVKAECREAIEENILTLVDSALRAQLSNLAKKKPSLVGGADLFSSYPGVRQMITVKASGGGSADRDSVLLPQAKLRQLDEWLNDGSRLTTRRARNPGIAAMLRDAYSVESNPEATLEDALRKFKEAKEKTGS